MLAKEGEVEATAVLNKREDGWRIQFHFDNGIVTEQDNEPFETQAEAQAALDEYIRLAGLRTYQPN